MIRIFIFACVFMFHIVIQQKLVALSAELTKTHGFSETVSNLLLSQNIWGGRVKPNTNLSHTGVNTDGLTNK